MYEYFLFYWILWMLYIVVYFFMDSTKKRSCYLVWILLTICTLDLSIYIGDIQFSIVIIIVVIGAICMFIENAVTLKNLFNAFIVMISYGGLLIWHQIAPVWYFLPAYMMIPILLVGFILFLERNKLKGLPILLLGMSFGQCIYQILLITYQLTDKFVQLSHLVQMNVAVLLLLWIYAIERAFNYVSNIVHR